MKGNTKELVGWQLLRYCCVVRLAPNHALYVTSIWIANGQVAADYDCNLGHALALPGMPSYLLNCL